VPLTGKGNLIGVLSLYSTGQSAFTEDHQRIVEVVSRQVSTILKGAVDFDKTRSTSFRDQLTGLPNIEHLYHLTRAYSGSDAISEPFSIVVLDVDNMAEINSSFGEAGGDQVLARIVRATRRSLRGADFLFRYRDDEFVVLLLQTDEETSLTVVRRIADALRKEAAMSSPSFSVSIGSATGPNEAHSIDDLIAVAAAGVRKRRSEDPRQSSGTESIH
jgi:diguanylate cyclase (GGDEF)-like protein